MPAGEYPDSGIKDLQQDIAIARGVTILNNAIQQQLAAGNTVNVVGYSQGANIASLEMQMLDPSGTPSSLPINFVLLGNSMNPNGGWDARFPGLKLPSLGFSTLGPVGAATTAFSTAYATLLPTADITTAVLISLPSYDFNLFLNGVTQMANGQPLDGLINAIGYPIAADVGLLPLTAGLEFVVLSEAVDTIVTGTPYPSP
jgi:hypothetical protein